MSIVGRKPIGIATGVSVNIESNTVVVSGPKGKLEYVLPTGLTVKQSGDVLNINRSQDTKSIKSLHGTWQRILQNAIIGTTDGWSKELELVGTGYRARMEEGNLILAIGFSHPVKFTRTEGINFLINENKIKIEGIDKHLVGQIAANVRAVRPPEPYKGKGIKYTGEYVRRKAGKAAKTATA